MRDFRSTWKKATAWVRRFASDKKGNVAIVFAITSVTLMSAGGAGVDLARAVAAKNRMATALDAAALAVGSTNGLSTDSLTTMAQQYFNANYNGAGLATATPVHLDVSGQQVTLSVDGSMPTTLLQAAGVDSMHFTVTNQVLRAMSKLRVALVLDNTGSMSETDASGTSKISALKTATHQLLTQLQGAAVNPGDVQVAIIPFALDVNDGTGVASSTWIDWTDYDAPPPNSMPSANSGPNGEAKSSSCPYSTGTSPFGYGCLNLSSGKIPGSGTNKGRIYPGTDNGNYNTGRGGHKYNGYYDSVKQVASCSSNCTYNHTWHSNGHAAWSGCFMDRVQNHDTTNDTPSTSDTDTLFPAENNSYCPPVTLTGLTYDWTSLNSKVDAMTPNGSTNQTIGLAWGWQALTQNAPLNAPAVADDTKQVIILLSDGMNTQDRWYGDGSHTSTQVDARMALACSNAKAAHVQIYTVLVMAGSSSVLQDCASDTSKYYALTTAGQIITTFNTIGTQLANLHLTL